MYYITDNTTNENEILTEREAVAKYGSDKVNAMLFGMDPDMSLHDSSADDCEMDIPYEGDYL